VSIHVLDALTHERVGTEFLAQFVNVEQVDEGLDLSDDAVELNVQVGELRKRRMIDVLGHARVDVVEAKTRDVRLRLLTRLERYPAV